MIALAAAAIWSYRAPGKRRANTVSSFWRSIMAAVPACLLLVNPREQPAHHHGEADQADDDAHRQHDHRHTQPEPHDHEDEPEDHEQRVFGESEDSAKRNRRRHGFPPCRNRLHTDERQTACLCFCRIPASGFGCSDLDRAWRLPGFRQSIRRLPGLTQLVTSTRVATVAGAEEPRCAGSGRASTATKPAPASLIN